MRRTTQSTITDRIFGICQDRQAVAVVGNARRMTVLLRLWGKRTLCYLGRQCHAVLAWFSARSTATEFVSCHGRSGHPRALDHMGFVEVITSGRC